MNAKIVLLPGDGIGPEVVAEAVRVLDVIAGKFNHQFAYEERLMGGCSIDRFGSSLTEETLADCQAAGGYRRHAPDHRAGVHGCGGHREHVWRHSDR